MAAPLWSNHVSETFYCRVSSHGKNTIINPAKRHLHWHMVTPAVEDSKHWTLMTFSSFEQPTQNTLFQLCSSTYFRQNACAGESSQGTTAIQRESFQWLSLDYSISMFDIMKTAEWGCQSFQRQCRTPRLQRSQSIQRKVRARISAHCRALLPPSGRQHARWLPLKAYFYTLW